MGPTKIDRYGDEILAVIGSVPKTPIRISGHRVAVGGAARYSAPYSKRMLVMANSMDADSFP